MSNLIPPGTNALLVTGRPVSNYAECNVPIPGDRAIHNCLGCQIPVTISLQADEILRTRGKEPGIIMAGAMCPACITRATEVAGGKPTITSTALGEESLRTNPASREFYELLQKKAERP